MSRSTGLQKLSVAYLRVYRFNCPGTEQSDYLVKLETDPRTLEHCFVVYYAVLRAHRLFLFSHDASKQCKDVVNLEQSTVRDTPLDKQWPSCCTFGCQIWLPGCDIGLAVGTPVPAEMACCWQLGFFAGSKWKRALEFYTKQKGPVEPTDVTDGDYDNDEYDAGDPELSGLWATLAELQPSQVGGSLSVDTNPKPMLPPPPLQRPSGRFPTGHSAHQTPPPPPPGPKPSPSGGGGRFGAPPPVRRTPVVQPSAAAAAPTPGPPPPQQTLLDTPVPPIKPFFQQPSGRLPTSHSQPQIGGPRFPLKPKPQQQQQQQQQKQQQQNQTPAPSQPPPPPPPPPFKPLGLLEARKNLNQASPPLPSQPAAPQPQLQQPTPPPVVQKPLAPPVPPRDALRGPSPDPPPAALQQAQQQQQQQRSAPSDLYQLMSQGLCVDALCSYFCRGYYSAKDMSRARLLMKQAQDDGVYMLRGFCNRQAGQDKTLCVKYSMVYKFRIRVLQDGYQICNDHNSMVHGSMEALLFYHHLFPIRVAQQIKHELLLHRPYDLEPKGENYLMLPLSSALWSHGSKEMCAEILRNSEDGTYTLRFDPDSGGAVLCVTHRGQILKFRIVASKVGDDEFEFNFHHLPTTPKFSSLEDFIVYHHKSPIRGSSADGDIILKMPFQLVPRCQQELDFQQISLDATIFTTGSVAAVSNKVARMRGGNFQVVRRSQQPLPPLPQQPQEDAKAPDAANASTSVEHTLIVRDDLGSVKTFRIIERDTDLSFRPQKTFTLEDRPELVTDRIEKMVHFLCLAHKFLSPDITSLVKP